MGIIASILPILLMVIIWGALIGLGIYALISIIKYTNRKPREEKLTIMVGGKPRFLMNANGNLLININNIKSIYLENFSVYAQLFDGETYIIKKCQDENSAKEELQKTVELINSEDK
ncbi:hypothetical protein [Anaerovorax odorimutans]|uniref:hypothetical protein n=1 Tax=Anaerovorax odorimutans TaxID=109327 RepID=UPI000407EF15|nr:hypothetical protein [Anaerovorax odorimutans]